MRPGRRTARCDAFRSDASCWPDYPATQRAWVALWVMLGVLWVLIANAALYPGSTFGDHPYRFAQAGWRGIEVSHAISTMVGAFVLLATSAAVVSYTPASSRRAATASHRTSIASSPPRRASSMR